MRPHASQERPPERYRPVAWLSSVAVLVGLAWSDAEVTLSSESHPEDGTGRLASDQWGCIDFECHPGGRDEAMIPVLSGTGALKATLATGSRICVED